MAVTDAKGATRPDTPSLGLGDRSTPALLAAWKTLLGELINSGARLRFFPHRAMMFLALAELAQDTERTALLLSAETTITEFGAIVRGLTVEHKSFGVAPELSPWLDGLMSTDRPAFDAIVARFSNDSVSILAGMRSGSNQKRRIVDLAAFVATDLFHRMNKLVSDFAHELAEVSLREQANAALVERERSAAASSNSSISHLTEDLDRVNLTVHMISINAMIQATRSGEDGKAFGIIAAEIQKLSGEVRTLTHNIRAQLSQHG